MARGYLRFTLAACLAAAALGCGSDKDFTPAPPFDNADDVRVWATSASAVSVYSHAYKPIAVADAQDHYADSACPVLSDDGTTLTLTGDCTDQDGHEWKGKASVERDGDDRKLTLSGFDGNQGTLTLHATAAQDYEFEAELVIGGVTTIHYSGSVTGSYGARSTWNGGGHVKRDGFLAPNGEVDATTENEVVDDAVCAGQPVSGTTTLQSGSDLAVITYDGEKDCDKDQNAALSVNGKDRGLIDGISCGIRGAGGPVRSATATWLCGLALLAKRLRRRSGPTISRAVRRRAALLARSARCRCKA